MVNNNLKNGLLSKLQALSMVIKHIFDEALYNIIYKPEYKNWHVCCFKYEIKKKI